MKKPLDLSFALLISGSLLFYPGCGKPQCGEKTAFEPASVVLTDSDILSKALCEAGDLFDASSSNSITVSRQGGFAIVQQTFPALTSNGLLRAGPERTTVWIDEKTGTFATPPGVQPLADEEVLSILKEYNPHIKSSLAQNPTEIKHLGGIIVATIGGAPVPSESDRIIFASPFVYRVRIDEGTRQVILWEAGN